MGKIDRKLSLERQNKARVYIGHCLAKLQPGESLPSLREMIQATETSRLAVSQALDYYKNLNMVEVKPRSGIVKCGSCIEGNGRIVDLIACHETGYFTANSGFCNELLTSLYVMASVKGYALRMHQIPADDAESICKYQSIREAADSGGYILLMPRVREVVRFFEASGKPVVCAFPQPALRDVRQVADSSGIMKILVDHLVENGHRNIAYLAGFEDEWNESLTALGRRLEYYRLMAEHGFQVNPCWCSGSGETYAKLDKTLEIMFANPPLPTAIITVNYITNLYQLLDKYGYRPGENISVAAIECCNDPTNAMPGVSAVRNSREEAAALIWQLFEEQSRGDNSPRLCETPTVLIPGNSVINIKINH